MAEEKSGVEVEEFELYNIPVQRIHILDEETAKHFGKIYSGTYTTITTGPLNKLRSLEDICNCLAEQLRPHLESFFGKPLCICGIGNRDLSADSLGPETAKRLMPQMFETAEIPSNFSKVVVICPDVYGKTNLATETIVSSIASAMDAACILSIDACATTDVSRLCSCIQLTDAGIDNYHQTISLRQSTVGIPVISIGVPTAIYTDDFLTKDCGAPSFSLTPSHINKIIYTAALIIACAITQILYPALSYEDCRQCIELFTNGVLP